MKRAVLLLAHGTPDSASEVPEYLGYVTGGRQLPPAVVEEIQHRYAQVGRSPLTEITRAQAAELERAAGVPVYVGMRNWHPFIADTVAQMLSDGITEATVICLAPQNSRTSVGLYRRAVNAAAAGKMEIEFIDSWHDHPELIAGFAEKLVEVRAKAPQAAVVFTAHSVPCRTICGTPEDHVGDPYAREAKETAELVARRVGLDESKWHFAFQSQGQSGGPWIGPTVEDTLRALAAEGRRQVIVQPIGFLCDHVEVLYDIDIAFRELAAGLGMELMRAESLNTSPRLIAALRQLVAEPSHAELSRAERSAQRSRVIAG